MDSSVDEEEVITSTADSRRERDGSNESIITSLKSLDRVSTTSTGSVVTVSPSTGGASSTLASATGSGSTVNSSLSLPVRTANGTVVFTSVPSPSGVKHNPVSQTIAVPQPGGSVSIVQLLPNQSNVVQSVIQPVNQQSVIQATGGAASASAAAVASVQAVSIPKNIIFFNKGGQGSVIQSTETNEMNSMQPVHLISSSRSDHGETLIPSQHTTQTPSPLLDEESKKRREVLERRPSYRKILNDLSSADVGSSTSIADIKSEDDGESSESSNAATIAVSSPYVKVVPASAIQLASASQDGTIQGLQTLTMTNAASGGNTIVQYTTQGQDGQFFVPVTVSAADLQAYQLRASATGVPTGLPQGVVMTSPTTLTSPHGQNAEEAAKKRELRLAKNREAAKECRRKKKEYIKCLEQHVNVLEQQNKALIEELKSLKELYCQKE
ncbi:cyclic AMP-dependent transcription factor ATF-1 [Tetranychus urticae]|uniref:BZIP domain-containing protein n=1 Tax=Tetranychus urticae TaxID=32264 RepID=T1KBR9_TETUR|nr:cyclic AMP-dependent transcription factor ATF-1 [Tetranychus urticae]XP_015784845.1 cyclic AMP-dependent transcription factor ATF-1 [Tetranychus urticae]